MQGDGNISRRNRRHTVAADTLSEKYFPGIRKTVFAYLCDEDRVRAHFVCSCWAKELPLPLMQEGDPLYRSCMEMFAILVRTKSAHCTRLATYAGRLDMLRYAHENGCPWHEITTYVVAGNGHLDCLRYVHKNGCPWNDVTTYVAAANGHLDCLRYAHENGCPWDGATTCAAAANGHLDCLRYVHENGCPWNKSTTWMAAAYGHLSCLRYAHENGCPWHKMATWSAADNGHFECLRYAHENKCPSSQFPMLYLKCSLFD